MGIGVDRERSAARIEREIETLSGPEFTTSSEAIRRYAYTPEYRRTLDHFGAALSELGFTSTRTPSARSSRATGRPASRRSASARTATRTGTAAATTARWASSPRSRSAGSAPSTASTCRCSSISFLEEEGSGFGQMLLGSRIMLQRVTEEDLRERFRAIDDGRSFWEHAEAAGLRARALARVDPRPRRPDRLDRDAHRAGARAPGHGQADRRSSTRSPATSTPTSSSHGRGDHAGATPMGLRLDPTTVLAETVLELERLATRGRAAARSARSARSSSTRA